MANELSRLGDRLGRAREGIPRGASVWITPPARREPTRAELVHRLTRDQREAVDADAEQPEREATTWVAIHVEVRQPTGDGAPRRVIDTYAHEPPLEPVEAEATQPFAVDVQPSAATSAALPAPALLESAREPVNGRLPGLTPYVAARALSAYRTQRSFGASAREPLLDLRA